MRHSKPLVDGLLQRTVSPAAGVSPGQVTQYCAPEHNSDAPDSLRIYCRSDSHYVSQEFVQSEGMVVTMRASTECCKNHNSALGILE